MELHNIREKISSTAANTDLDLHLKLLTQIDSKETHVITDRDCLLNHLPKLLILFHNLCFLFKLKIVGRYPLIIIIVVFLLLLTLFD